MDCPMTPIISLPWYDLERTTAQLDSFFPCLREQLLNQLAEQELDLPVALERTLPLPEQWQSQGLLLGQCCGGDLFLAEGSSLYPLARPVFARLDCEPGYYYSHVVASNSLGSAPRIAVNARSSYSGCFGLFRWLDAQGIQTGTVIESGSHMASLTLLHNGEVDLVAIDANTWQLLDLSDRHIIGRTEAAPSPPFVCHEHWQSSADAITRALQIALHRIGPVAGIQGIVKGSKSDYQEMADTLDFPSCSIEA